MKMKLLPYWDMLYFWKMVCYLCQILFGYNMEFCF
jgi:hypothetical protein